MLPEAGAREGAGPRVRIATYNVHKCRGLDRRVSPQRIADVLREVDADVVALQEVVSLEGGSPEEDQGRYLAEIPGMEVAAGPNRLLGRARYGNVVLSRLPMRAVCNHDLSVEGRERRGCLHADVTPPGGQTLHVFALHLGTGFLERRHQARRLVDRAILGQEGLEGCRVVLGDFNEWTSGLVSRLVSSHLVAVDVRRHLKRRCTYPGVLPFLHLDHIYFEARLGLLSLELLRSRTALVASDHLPLVATFQVPARAQGATAATGSAPLAREDRAPGARRA